jgi:C_GCAxxG_C_C family probable redox protein
MNNIERTVDLFSNGMICAQAVLTVFGEPHGLDLDMVTKLGRPLGGGMGHAGLTCGAISAAVLILGLEKDHPDESEARKVSFQHVQQLFRRFKELHSSTECKDLLGADWSTEEGTNKIREENLVTKLCPTFVRDAATILEDLLDSGCEPMSKAGACCGR